MDLAQIVADPVLAGGLVVGPVRAHGVAADGVAQVDAEGLQAAVGQRLVRRQRHLRVGAVDGQLEAGHGQVGEVVLPGHLATDQRHAEASGGRHAVHSLDPGPHVRVDP